MDGWLTRLHPRLSGKELAQVMERVLQRPIIYQDETGSARVRELLSNMPEWEQGTPLRSLSRA